MCSGVPEFAAYFRQPIPEVRVKPTSDDQTPVSYSSDLRFCRQKSDCARRFSSIPHASGNLGFRLRLFGSRYAASNRETRFPSHVNVLLMPLEIGNAFTQSGRRRFLGERFFRLRWSCSATKIFSVGFLLIPLVAPYDQNLDKAYQMNGRCSKACLRAHHQRA